MPVVRLIDELAKLPGIGRRSAERLALHLMKADASVAASLAGAIGGAKSAIRHCGVCANLTESATCAICADASRDAGLVLVVEQPRDLLAIELTGMYKGTYHVLLGRLSPIDGIGPDALTIADLLARVRDGKRNARGVPVREVILGLNPTLEGDGTALYLADALGKASPKVKLSRLARGLPSGSSIEFANKAVLVDALAGRTGV